ncbi:hypothetical protein D3C77_672170 [compost metagenome]
MNSGMKPTSRMSFSDKTSVRSFGSITVIQLMNDVVYGMTDFGIHSSKSGIMIPPIGFFGMRAR